MTVDGSVVYVGKGSWWEEGNDDKGFTWRTWLQLGIPGCSHGFHNLGNAAVRREEGLKVQCDVLLQVWNLQTPHANS